jgi:predicted TIM-barrel fold metal-dependent hydrolase
MAKLAACPNVVSKISGLGTFIHSNDPAHVADVLTETVRIFGPERCLFGSNFPIEKLWTDYRNLVKAYVEASAPLSASQRDAIFKTTALRVYRL